MQRNYRVGIIGFAHMHINHVAALFAEHPQVTMAACADTRPDIPERREAPYTRQWNQKHALEDIGVQKAYDTYEEMLDVESLDLIICCSENDKHPAVVEACAERGIHVCVEKPMAMDLSGARQMVRACQRAGTALAVNWPMAWEPAIRQTKKLLDEGVIGRILQIKMRRGHTGPLGAGAAHAGVSETAAPMTEDELSATWWHRRSAGGGAMLDFCCYGAMASRWFLDEQAQGVLGLAGNLNSPWGDADDNGVMVIQYPGAMGIVEGTWTTVAPGIPGGPVVYGTQGTLVVGGQDGETCIRVDTASGSTTHACPPLPEGRQQISEELIHHLDTGEPLHPMVDAALNVEVMAIIDAALRSVETRKQEQPLNEHWQLG